MLNFFRSNAQSIVVKAFLGLLILSFGVWGIADFIGGSSRSDVIVRVGDTKITAPQLEHELVREMGRFSQQLGTTLTHSQAQSFNLHGLVLSRMIAESVLNQDAKHLKLRANADTLKQSILNNPIFQDSDGAFSAANLARYLQNAGLSEQGFLQSQRDLVLRRLVAQAVSGETKIPLSALNVIERYLEERRDISYITLHIDDITEDIPLSDEDLSAYYEETKDTWQSTETRDFSIAVLDYSGLKDGMTIPQSDIDARIKHLQVLSQSDEKRDILQFVFQNQEDANAALAQLRSGQSPDDISEQYGLDAQAVKLGLLARGDVVSPVIADVAFALEKGAFSDVIAGPFGPTVVGVVDIQSSVNQVADADTLKDKARDSIANERVYALVRDLERDIDDARLDGKDGKTIANDFALVYMPFTDITRDSSLESLNDALDAESAQKILDAVFSGEVGLDVPIVRSDTASYFITLENIKPAAVRPFDDAKEDVKSQLLRVKKREELEQRALQALSKLQSGDITLNDLIAVDDSLQTKAVTRGTQDAPFHENLINHLFSTPQSRFHADVGQDADTYVLARIDRVTLPAPIQKIEDAKADILDSAVGQVQDDLLGQYIISRQEDFGLKINEDNLNALLSRLRGDNELSPQ